MSCSFVCKNLRRLSVWLKWKRFCYEIVGVGLTWTEITEICPYTCFENFSFSKKIAWGFFKGGVTEGGGFDTAVRGTIFVRNGAVTPGPSRKCNITWVVKGRPKPAQQLHDSTVAGRKTQSVTVLSSRVTRECRSTGLRSPCRVNACL